MVDIARRLQEYGRLIDECPELQVPSHALTYVSVRREVHDEMKLYDLAETESV